jgi:hypothetical protein
MSGKNQGVSIKAWNTFYADLLNRLRRGDMRNPVDCEADLRNFVPGEYEPATVHEKKMPINIGRSAFSE